MNILRNARKAGQNNHGRQGQQAPYIDQNNRHHGQVGLPQPDRQGVGRKNGQRSQGPVNDAVDRIKNPEPAYGAQRNRRDPGQQDKQPNQPAPTKILIQGHGQYLSQNHQQHLGNQRQDD